MANQATPCTIAGANANDPSTKSGICYSKPITQKAEVDTLHAFDKKVKINPENLTRVDQSILVTSSLVTESALSPCLACLVEMIDGFLCLLARLFFLSFQK